MTHQSFALRSPYTEGNSSNWRQQLMQGLLHYDICQPCECRCPGPVFCLLFGVSLDYAPPITGQVTEVTCPVIGRVQPKFTPSKRQKTGSGAKAPGHQHSQYWLDADAIVLKHQAISMHNTHGDHLVLNHQTISIQNIGSMPWCGRVCSWAVVFM